MAPGASLLNEGTPGVIDQWTIDIILRGDVQARKATEAFFVFVDAPHLFARLQNFGNSAKIEIATATRLRPLNAAILQQVGWFQIAFVVGRGPEHVPTPIAKTYEHF